MTMGFADQIRELPDDRLAALLRLRPDLVVPVPADLSALAARAQARVSVARALDTLDRFTLEILDALRLARVDGRADVDAVLALTAAAHPAPDPVTVRAALDRLRELFLVYGPEDELTVVPGVDEVTSPYPAGLGRPAAELDPAAALLCADAAGLRRTVLAAPPPSRAVLDRLAAGPPIGSTTTGATADPDSAVGWLVERRLLVPTSETTVELPREVGLLLRRDDGPLGPLHPTPPEPEAPQRPLDAVDSAGAGQAMEVVRHTEELLDALSLEPAPVLKAGGLGVRDLRRLARLTGLAEAGTATVIEVAAAAGLLGETYGETGGEPAYLPTTGYDAWRMQSIAGRWTALARAWLTMPRQPGLIGRRDERDRAITALSSEVDRVGAPALRGAALAVLAADKPGYAPGADQVLAVLGWRCPRRYDPARDGARVEAVRSVLAEAALLRVTGLGAFTGYGRALFDELLSAGRRDPDEDPLGVLGTTGPAGSGAVELLDRLVPPPVDHVLVQAGRTVVRGAGYAPVPEDATGAMVLRRPRARRAPPRRLTGSPRSLVDEQRPLPPPRLAGIVEQLRRADTLARTARRAPVTLRVAGNGGQEHTQTMAVLQQALRDRRRVWVGYVDSHGGTAALLVRPVSIGAGYLRAEDDRPETVHTFALHRITAAVVEAE